MVSKFQPDWASPPGATIQDILEERGWSLSELSNRLDLPIEKVSALLDGRTCITIDLANSLEKVLGSSSEFWMRREEQYRTDLL